MYQIHCGRAGEAGMGAARLDAMFRLRAEVFHQRLGWEVAVSQGREVDWFDAVGPRYVVLDGCGGSPGALGCARLLPAEGPNMLRDVFGFLLDGRPCPQGPDLLEVSRFALSDAAGRGCYGFREAAATLVAAVLDEAADAGAGALVGVTSAGFERLLRGLGLRVSRLGRVRRIGSVASLAFELPLDAGNLAAVARHRAPRPLPVAA